MTRAFNFSAGPAVLPEEVLEQARDELLDYEGTGVSIMESSHRGKAYTAVHDEAIENMRKLMNLSDDHTVLFLQGGASTQFAMVPLNLLGKGESADYTNSGSWASKAVKEAKTIGDVNVIADTAKDIPTKVPTPEELSISDNAAYLHITSNETISGAQWKNFPRTDVPLVADMSSDILSRPIDFNRFGLIYAGAQKNLGPSGVTLVVMRKDLAEKAGDDVPIMFRYKTHIEANSLYNTAPCFSIYLVMLVTRWILKNGGLEGMEKHNADKAAKLYTAIDASAFYSGTAIPEHRSAMNVTFRLPSEELEAQFVKEAGAANMSGLKGHRSVGGIRASIYNAFPPAGVDALIDFMKDFEQKNG
ncbi:MAG: 3-phosphoserine/phosphohydroxythreonine transaminase [Verrucomicrobiota bacterium]